MTVPALCVLLAVVKPTHTKQGLRKPPFQQQLAVVRLQCWALEVAVSYEPRPCHFSLGDRVSLHPNTMNHLSLSLSQTTCSSTRQRFTHHLPCSRSWTCGSATTGMSHSMATTIEQGVGVMLHITSGAPRPSAVLHGQASRPHEAAPADGTVLAVSFLSQSSCTCAGRANTHTGAARPCGATHHVLKQHPTGPQVVGMQRRLMVWARALTVGRRAAAPAACSKAADEVEFKQPHGSCSDHASGGGTVARH